LGKEREYGVEIVELTCECVIKGSRKSGRVEEEDGKRKN
jgi:hypothetical protein